MRNLQVKEYSVWDLLKILQKKKKNEDREDRKKEKSNLLTMWRLGSAELTASFSLFGVR